MRFVKKYTKRITAFLLTLLVLVGALPLSVSAAESNSSEQNVENTEYSNSLNGWKIKSSWSNYSDTYTWNADSDATQQPKAIVTYRIENLSKTYNIGEMTIWVPGIGISNRASVKKATSIAGENSDSDWNLDNYDQTNDVYTFKNAVPFREGESVNGGFEIIWTLNSRETSNDYSQTKSVVFSDGNGEINLPPLTFEFTSVRDLETVTMEKQSLSGEEYQLLDKDITWYKIFNNFTEDVRARGVNKSKYFVTLTLPSGTTPEDIQVYDAKTYKHLENYIGKVLDNKITLESLGDNKYGFWLFKDRYDSLNFVNHTFLLGLDKTKFEAKELGIEGSLQCLFQDETEWVDDNNKLSGETYKASDVQTVISYSFPKGGEHGGINGNKYMSRYAETPHTNRLNVKDIFNNAKLEYTLLGKVAIDYGEPVYNQGTQNSTNSVAKTAKASPKNTNTNKVGSESVGASDSYVGDMVLGDNLMSVVLKNGEIRMLDDSEYHFDNIKLPSFDNKRFRIYVSETHNANYTDVSNALTGQPVSVDSNGVKFYSSGSTPVPDNSKPYYYCYAEGNLANHMLTVKFPANKVKAYYIVIYDVDKSVSYEPRGTAILHFNSNQELSKATSLQVDSEKYITNYMFLRYFVDRDGRKVDLVEIDDYAQTFAQAIKDWDLEKFDGHLLYREADEAWLKSSETVLTSDSVINDFNLSNRRQFTTTLTSTGTIKSGESGTLKKFSLITAIPSELKVTANENDFIVEGINNPESPISDHVSFRRITKNGKTYLIADFDYTTSPLDLKNLAEFSVKYPATLDYYDFADFGNQYSVETFVMIQDEGVDHMSLAASKLRYDTEDYDNDGKTNEKGAYSSDDTVIEETAQAWSEYALKEVKSYYNTSFSTEAITKRYDASASAAEKEKSYYTYRLDFGVGVESVKNIVFYDTLENGATITKPSGDSETINSEWSGTLEEVDTSYVSNHNFTDNRKLIPTVYYTTNSNPARDLTDSDSGWTTTMPADKSQIKAIAVHLDTQNLVGGALQSGQAVYINLKMLATDDMDAVGKKTVNQYYIQYDEVGDNNSALRHTELPSSETYVKLMNKIGQKTLRKIDADSVIENSDGSVSYNRLAGAKLQIYDSTGAPLFQTPITMNRLGEYVLQNIECGTYYWEETEAPEGYVKATGRHKFVVTENAGEIELIKNSRQKGSVSLRKGDTDNGDTLFIPGAVYRLYNESGDLLYTTNDNVYSESSDAVKCDFTTEGDEKYVKITGLPWGKYYFMEYAAPVGYTLSTQRYEFEIGRETRNEFVAAENTEIKSKGVILKLDEVSKSPLKNAQYSLEKFVNGKWSRWIGTSFKTNAIGEAVAENLSFGKYRWREEKAPVGYDENNDYVEFEITPETAGGVFKTTQEDPRKQGSVRLQKTDTKGKPLKGAVYSLYKENGELVKDGLFTDAYGETETVKNLEWGNYYFKEIKAPNGYKLSNENIIFTVDAVKSEFTQTLTATDEKQLGSVKLIKTNKYTDEADKLLLEGAVFNLYTSDNKLVKENLTTGVNGEINLSDLEWGSYYFSETQAPAGYSVTSEKIRFSINASNASKTQVVNCVNKQGLCEIKVDKVINDQYADFGNATFIFQVVGTDLEGKEHVYTKSLTISNGKSEGSIVFSEIPHGTYQVREKEIARYKQSNFKPVTSNVRSKRVSFDGKTKAVAVIDLSQETFGEVRFTNNMKQYEKLSHNDEVLNILSKGRKLVGITVDYVGSNPIKSNEEFSYTFKDSDLVVTAYYDNDTTKVVPFGEYELSPETVSSLDNASGVGYTVDVNYTEDGISASDSFNVKLELKDTDQKLRLTFYADNDNSGSYFLYDNSKVNEIGCYEENGTDYIMVGKLKEPYKDRCRFLGWYTTPDFQRNSKVDVKVKPSIVSTESDSIYLTDKSGNQLTFADFADGSIDNQKLVEVKLYAKWGPEGDVLFEGNNFTIYDNGLMTIQGDGELDTNFNSLHYEDFLISCMDVEKIIVNGNVTSVPNSFFSDYVNVEEITLPESFTEISNNAFRDCRSLVNVNLTGEITSIGRGAFYNCESLESYNIPNTVTNIGKLAFYNCESLTEIALPASVQEMGDAPNYGNQVWVGCSGLEKITVSPENSIYDSRNDCNAIIETASNQLVVGCQNTVIDDSVTSLGDWAFYGHDELEYIDIPESITSIGKQTFNGTGLTEIFIPKNVESIGSLAFANCANLNSASVDSENSVYDSRNDCNAVVKTSTNTIVVGTNNTVIPTNVSGIGNYAFEGREGIFEIDIPSNVTSIGTSAFNSCKNLNEVHLHDGLRAIGTDAFAKCNLNEITVPNTVTSISNEAFINNNNLTSVVIPSSVRHFPTQSGAKVNLFEGCNSLESLVIPYDDALVDTIRNTDSIKNLTLNYSAQSYISRTSLPPMPNLETVVIGEGITEIQSGVTYQGTKYYSFFESSPNLKTVVLPNGLTTIGGFAFSDCKQLQTINIPSSVTVIETQAFGNCISLRTIDLSECNVEMLHRTFQYCSNLQKVKLPSTLNILGERTFLGCKALESIESPDGMHTLPVGLTEIQGSAFKNCESLERVVIPNTVTKFGNEMDTGGYDDNLFQFAYGCLIDCRQNPTAATFMRNKGYVELAETPGVYQYR